ncbi:MAG TPA: transcription elongation factor GreA [Thermotogota bacterium]|jgi:transcription elongation factor GreA|nr:transcription elongation factor GreA [Thermotogota bacterium]NLZ13587.1 transcription elongation factor GreA [Thermotogaceae bacterium]MDD8041445.1 transcription elongation factor GreA [Thermotogota bacterium]MDD8053190.1 transcription elongation factor GreA [Thermotogota bacterium]HNR63008.1 transcription elongation factor GreA [Thermotogota bacterium]
MAKSKDIIYLTKEGFDSLNDELKQLREKLMYDIAQRIKEAREFGDLSENSEYEEAKNEQGRINGRIIEIENILQKAEIIDPNDIQTDVINLGHQVLLKDLKTNKEQKIKIVNSQEADIFEKKISVESPLGKEISGRRVGEEIRVKTPGGIQRFKIMGIEL